jgi:hypothetical protein
MKIKFIITCTLIFVTSTLFVVESREPRERIERPICRMETRHRTETRTRDVNRMVNIPVPHRREGVGGAGGKAGVIKLNMFNEDIEKSFIVKIDHSGIKGENGAPPKCP